MAESALGDVETLRRLLLHSFLPAQDSETEDDLTPTPSGLGHKRPWGLEASAQEGLTGPPSSGPTSDPGPGEGQEAMAPPMAQAGKQQPETPSGYLVVRKGNCFYLSLPADVKKPQAGAKSAGETVDALSRAPSLPTAVPLPGCQESTRETPARGLSMAEFPASSQGVQDVDAIFRTIDQLARKLSKLKDVEGAYQRLLLRQPPPKGHSTAQATPGQGSVSPELSWMSPGPRRGSRASPPSLPSSPQSPVAAKPDVNGLSLALPEDGSQEVTL